MEIWDLGAANRSLRCSEWLSDGTVNWMRSQVQCTLPSATPALGFTSAMRFMPTGARITPRGEKDLHRGWAWDTVPPRPPCPLDSRPVQISSPELAAYWLVATCLGALPRRSNLPWCVRSLPVTLPWWKPHISCASALPSLRPRARHSNFTSHRPRAL
jgi:hypothetical protein